VNKCFADFRAITIAQHLLGLAAGAIFLVAWQRIHSFMRAPRLPQPLYAFIGLMAATIYLTGEEPIRFETDVRPEGIVSFLIILNIFLILEFSYRCYLRSPRVIPVILGLCAVISSIITTLAKPSLAIAAAGALYSCRRFAISPVLAKKQNRAASGIANGCIALDFASTSARTA